jgi:alkylation response protein AidB-like acyl-CoA dehydrogenase
MQTTAARDGDSYVLNGDKTWITLANTADSLLVFAKTDPGAGASGISAFVVARNASGVSSTPRNNKLGDWAGDTGDLQLRDVRVSAADRLGYDGEGFKIAMSALDTGRYIVAAGAVGCMKACRDEALAYAKARHAFGKPIAEQQLVQQMLALMQQRIDIGALLVLKAGLLKNSGARSTRESSMAKWYCAEAAQQCASDAVQILGSAGYCDDFNAARHLRNSKASAIYQGTAQIHTLLQADYLSGRRNDRPLRCELPAFTAE